MESFIDPFIYTAARMILGVLFFFQGYDKVFRITLPNVYTEVSNGTYQKGIPAWFTRFSIFTSSYLELIGGLLLVSGLFTLPVLFLLMIHLLLVVTAFGYLQGVWDMKHVFPRLALALFLLLLPQSWNQWALDALFAPRPTTVEVFYEPNVPGECFNIQYADATASLTQISRVGDAAHLTGLAHRFPLNLQNSTR